jgi:DNA-binding MarR family transcriptional regulator
VVGGLVEAAIAAVARRYGLSHAALNALAVIEGEGQPMLTGEIASRMHITSGTITSLIDNLERKGYVRRSSDADDRRRVLVDITPAAQGVLDDLLPEVQQLTVHVIDRIGQKRQEALLDILAEIREAIAELPEELPAPLPRQRPERLTR